MKKYLYEKLKKKFGTHTAVAEELLVTPRHYRGIRAGKYPLTDKNKKWIMDLLKTDAQNTTETDS